MCRIAGAIRAAGGHLALKVGTLAIEEGELSHFKWILKDRIETEALISYQIILADFKWHLAISSLLGIGWLDFKTVQFHTVVMDRGTG